MGSCEGKGVGEQRGAERVRRYRGDVEDRTPRVAVFYVGLGEYLGELGVLGVGGWPEDGRCRGVEERRVVVVRGGGGLLHLGLEFLALGVDLVLDLVDAEKTCVDVYGV